MTATIHFHKKSETHMNKIFATLALLAASSFSFAAQETFITASPLDCTQVTLCNQNTSDGLFTLKFIPTYPTSAPSATGFNVNEPAVEIYPGPLFGAMNLNILSLKITGSNVFNGLNFIGAIQLESMDANSNWRYITQWSTYIGSSKGIYVMFRGLNASAPLVQGARAFRLTGVNGTTSFEVGMMTATAY
jgi:hypothetical protein